MIFVSTKGPQNSWRSFESDPHLRLTKKRIYERCVPCLSNLLQSLRHNPEKVDLSLPYNCWKITVSLLSLDDCFRFLELFSELWPDEYVHGKFGTGDPNRPTKAVVFHLEENRDWIIVLEPKVRCCAEKLSRPYELRITRGCSFPYEALFGSCENWQIEMGVINKENLGGVIKTLEKMLYY